ncbi:Piso0_002644 [Millerozyma farinosa CBS 7064]|uniref:Piso0_002644 protein n=1 Tax=Pichia sorbitophila (strain ATCC MYA-4447 / BCRC 22081 / CBS 7064 / NBRC 10061 / NRRL Y-12695) TaxID=559304 RepID=G8YD57_PICSO|nr:Piso0_002644 [Millerozyma farinosa CBS 7064]
MAQVRPVTTMGFVDMIVRQVPELKYVLQLGNNGPDLKNSHVYFLVKKVSTTVDNWSRSCFGGSPSSLFSLHTLWFTAHFFTILGTTGYLNHTLRSNLLNERGGSLWYSITICSCVTTYALVIYRYMTLLLSHSTKAKNQNERDSFLLTESLFTESAIEGIIPLAAILKSEDMYLLGFAVLALSSEENIFKTLSFFIYSFINLSLYLVNDLYQNASFSVAIAPLVNYVEEPLLLVAANMDFVTMFVYIKESLVKSQPYCLVLYTIGFCLKMESSTYSRIALHKILQNLTKIMIHSHLPVTLLGKWQKVIDFLAVLVPVHSLDNINQAVEDVEKVPDTRNSQSRKSSIAFDSFSIINDIEQDNISINSLFS